jgi:cold-inducible RNA-binding protein
MGKKLYVGGLSYNTDDHGLNDLFAQVGSVDSAKVITDRETGRSKGFGFVEMATDQEANAAIQKFNGAEVDGRRLTVNEAKPQAPRENRGGGGGYGGGGGGGGRNRW